VCVDETFGFVIPTLFIGMAGGGTTACATGLIEKYDALLKNNSK
jgi:hypothetical protein